MENFKKKKNEDETVPPGAPKRTPVEDPDAAKAPKGDPIAPSKKKSRL
jgi:hypothetical protein